MARRNAERLARSLRIGGARPHCAALRGQSSDLSTVAADVARALPPASPTSGIGRGDVVVVHLPNVPEFLIAWLAISEIGAVMQTVHTPYGPRELGHLITHGGGKAAIALARTKDRSPAAEIARFVNALLTLRSSSPSAVTCRARVDFATLLERAQGKPPPRGRTPMIHFFFSTPRGQPPPQSGVGQLQSLSEQRPHVRGRVRIWSPTTAFCASRLTRISTGFMRWNLALLSVPPPACSIFSPRLDLSKRSNGQSRRF